MNTKHTANLSNEDIIFLYLSALFAKQNYEKILESGLISKTIQVSENHYITQTIQLTEEELTSLAENTHYKHCLKICDNLEDVIGVIKEAFPDVYKKLEDSLYEFMDDDDYEEDTFEKDE